MGFFRNLFRRRERRDGWLGEDERISIIERYGAVLEARGDRMQLYGRLSDLPDPKPLIKQALREELLVKAFAEADPNLQRILGNGYVLLEMFLPDDEAQPLIASHDLICKLTSLATPPQPSEQSSVETTQLLGTFVQELASLPDSDSSWDKVQHAMNDSLRELQGIRALAMNLRLS